MDAQNQDNELSVECKATATETGYFVTGQFQYFVPISEFDNK